MFGPSSQTSQAMSQLGSNTGTTANFGRNLLNLGTGNTQQGANFFSTLLGGNRENATALLQPDINRIRGATQGQLQTLSTLMPRGGGRSGTLFSLPFEANREIQSLYNPLRAQAAGQLANIGAGQTGAGSNLFGISNQGASALGNLGITQQELTNRLWSQLGQGLFGLATTPLSTFSGGLFGGLAK